MALVPEWEQRGRGSSSTANRAGFPCAESAETEPPSILEGFDSHLTRAALSTAGREKTNFLSVFALGTNSSLPVAAGFPSFRIKSTGSFSITLPRQKGHPWKLLAAAAGAVVCPWLDIANVAISIAVVMMVFIFIGFISPAYSRHPSGVIPA
ncbi:MAG: hypothetical protein NT154_33425 [Verrucomicrobia bacterium]|nr:hypothetical protein [Verrucomicrobiota bacterium]